MNTATITEKGLINTPKSVTTKREMTWTQHGITIPVGTKLEVYFSERRPGRIYFEYNGRVLATITETAHKRLTGFGKPPGLKTLEKYNWDGIAKTVTGHRTEPDGYGPDGSPSWMLVLGYI